MSIEMSGSLEGWFRERLEQVLSRRQVNALPLTRVYLADLLARFGFAPEPERLSEPLVFQLAEAEEATGRERLRLFQKLGDAALYALGFFSDHLEHRGVSPSYVTAMGGRAYASAGALATYSPADAELKTVFVELGDHFKPYASVIDEVRESTSMRTPQDIVRLYERWRKTGAPRLAERLREEGVYPGHIPGSRLLH